MKKIKLGIVGFGNMGSSHAVNVWSNQCPEVELTAVADIVPSRLESAKKMAADNNAECPNLFSTAEDMLDSGLVDAILVATPHYDHPRYVIAAMNRGIHAMSEKPAGVYTKQVREMIHEADKHPDLTFAMMFNQRTNCIYRKMKEIMDSGELGELRRTSWIITDWYRPQFYYDSGAWRATWSGEGGGVLLNQCPHQLDLWQWICGMPISIDVKMHFGKWHDIEVEDDVTAYCTYANGATGTFITTTGDTPGANRFEIVCSKGTLVCEGGKLIMYKLEMSEPEFSRTNKTDIFGRPKTQRIEVETDGQNLQHVGVLNAFAANILRGEPLVADGREGINGLTISNAMHLSAWTEKEIKLPFDEELYYEELMKRVDTSRRKPEMESVLADTKGSY